MKVYKLFLFLLAVLILTGCSIKEINTKDYINNINTIISRESKYTNTNAIGYQYYVPNGVITAETTDFNQKLISDNMIYYLYTDVVSYYHNILVGYENNEDAYISEEIAHDNKRGYLEVNEVNDKYFIEMMFNYAKIESYVDKKDLSDALVNISYIISSIKYNDDVIDSMFGNEKYNLSDREMYNIFETKKTVNDNFLMYNEEYGQYEGNEAVDLIEKKEIEREKDN